MKRIAVFLLLIFSTQLVKANFDQGQSVNVVALSGLKLRTAPQHGHVLKIVPYGSHVTIIDNGSNDLISERIDWVDGKWIEVSHEGDVGFVFDGFLSTLSVPGYDSELIQSDMDVVLPLETWAEYRLLNVDASDTTQLSNGSHKVTHYFEGGIMVKLAATTYDKMELQLYDIRIMDAYHLILSMMPDKSLRNRVAENSIFIENSEGNVDEIKVNVIDPIQIKTMDDGQISIRVTTSESGC